MPHAATNDKLVRDAIKIWRDSLVNLTKRNRLLNFSMGKGRGTALEIVRPAASIIFDEVVTGATLEFGALRERSTADPEAPYGEVPLASIEDARSDVLGVDMEPDPLFRNLKTLATRANREFLDRGVWILHLAFGFVRWFDEDRTPYASPIVLVPVELVSDGPNDTPRLTASGNDAIINPALALRFMDFGIELPARVEADDTLESILDSIQTLLQAQQGWSVDDATVLSYFSFTKEAMYRDLKENEDLIAAHPIVQGLALGGRNAQAPAATDEIASDDVDRAAPPERQRLVLDADSSQRACVAAAVRGSSFVMDGPPGTGKSQTITNMIAGLIASGKSVLFVSEKAAALDVVRNRLSEQGLGAYVLGLHSHTATRKEVVASLGEALDLFPKPPPGISDADRARAADRRQTLTAYSVAINRQREPLSRRLHDVIGRIAQLADLPIPPAPRVETDKLTSEALNRILEVARDLERAWRPAIQGSSYVWRGVTTRAPLSGDFYEFKQALGELVALTTAHGELRASFGLDRPSQTDALCLLIDLAATYDRNIPDTWLTDPDLSGLPGSISSLSTAVEAIRSADRIASEAAGVDQSLLPSPDSLPVLDIPRLSPDALEFDSLTSDQLDNLADALDVHAETLRRDIATASTLLSLLGFQVDEIRAADCQTALAVARVALMPHRPLSSWFTVGAEQPNPRGVAANLRAAHDAFYRAGHEASGVFRPEALEADVSDAAHRLTHVHKGLRKLGGAYRSDKKAVGALAAEGVAAKVAVRSLPQLVAWRESAAHLRQLEATTAYVLGPYYRGPATDWAVLGHALDACDALGSAVSGRHDATSIASRACSDNLDLADVQESSEELANASAAWRRPKARGLAILPKSELLEHSLDDARYWLLAHSTPARTAAVRAAAVSRAVGESLSLQRAENLLSRRAAALAARELLDQNRDLHRTIFGALYRGDETDTGAIDAAYEWCLKVRRGIGSRDQAVSRPQLEALRATRGATGSIRRSLERWTEGRNALLNAFDAERHIELGRELDDFNESISLIDDLETDSSGQAEWFAYLTARTELRGVGLDPTVEFCIRERLSPGDVAPTIERAILTLWTERIFADDPALRTVRSADRDSLVREYQQLDRSLVSGAVSDVITAVNERRPQTDIGESVTIRREATKKSRHMPVRTLLERTRHVVQALKPCFMMSPLTVSQFLPRDLRFDVVIFDEASQVLPSDSINSIYRGTSLITAGDQKQLPPTAFFAASNDVDEEWTEETNDSNDFESVLDLAKSSGSVRTLSLKWHYRSRHEALIAFSNVRFYNGELVTFPSADDVGPHVGVELFKVDGVYRRGTSRDNLIEARKVAERVAWHYDQRPGLSLGVVTFSEAQASTVQAAIDELARERPDLTEKFELHDRLRGLFVKSLESVQGDERDVMIFSIGYGPDETKKLTMNFGPLNRKGGWRRLNVAITRARYRNEIVTSVEGGDIPDSTANDSLLALRSYLDFAARGMPALALDVSSGGDAESPFEESVLRRIRSWGYDVVPQVGAAGYRIDMAVRHPDRPGVYVLGIECDGFQYHSSRAARDRDRLRESVLEGLGWRLHRIWSTAWYRERLAEEQRLRNTIEDALRAPVDGLLSRATSNEATARVHIDMQTAEVDAAPTWTEPYHVGSVPDVPGLVDFADTSNASWMANAVTSVVTAESPIHLSLLYERLRSAWGIGRIGARIRATMDEAVTLSRVTRDGEFLTGRHNAVVVRTPVAACSRTISQVHDTELEAAVAHLVRDAHAIDRSELSQRVARIFGWQRQGNEIQARLERSISAVARGSWLSEEPDGTVVWREPR